jgi:hypothetical protein
MTKCQIAKDEVIFHLQGEISDKPSKRSIQVEKTNIWSLFLTIRVT